jgi:drug/metabolite transporter (DMT)-like permease
MTSKISKRSLAIISLIATNIIWAAAAPFAKMGFNEGLTPALFLQIRFILAAIFAMPIIFYLSKNHNFKKYLNARTLLTIIILEFFGTFLALFLFYAGVSKTTAIDATLLSTSMPLFVTLGGIVFLKEKESGYEFLGLILCFVGSLFLIFNGQNFTFDLKNSGNILIIAHNIVISAYYLLAKKYYKNIHKMFVSGIGFLVGALFFSLASIPNLYLATKTAVELGPWSSFVIVYMGILGSIIALTLYLYAQDKIEASEATIFTYLSPIFTIPLSFFLLGETVGQKELIAGTLILLGVILAQKRKK